MEIFNINHSLKDIPIPSKQDYLEKLINKIEETIKRIRWKTYFYLNEGNKNGENTINNFGFKTQKSPPRNKLLDTFEKEFVDIINKIEYRPYIDKFQKEIKEEVRKISKEKNILVRADKTNNIYKVHPDKYKRLMNDTITKKYRKDKEKINEDKINLDGKRITKQLKISDRVQQIQIKNAYILLKDHKQDFCINPTTRLINPTKTELGKISKGILERINNEVKLFFSLNLWKNTEEAIHWFKHIDGKNEASFIQFDIVDFYPTITEELLDNAIIMARTVTNITKEEIEIIKHCRKTLLYFNQEHWNKNVSSDFEISMGSLDSAQISDLIGLFILYNLTNSKNISLENVGLYRDDGLLIIKKANPNKIERTKKELIKNSKK